MCKVTCQYKRKYYWIETLKVLENSRNGWNKVIKPNIQPETEKVLYVYWANKTGNRWKSHLCHCCLSVSLVRGPPAVCTPGRLIFGGTAQSRIVFSATHRTPFIPGLSQEHRVKPALICKTTCYPAPLTTHNLKAQRLLFFSFSTPLNLNSLRCLQEAAGREWKRRNLQVWYYVKGDNSPEALNDMNITAGCWLS